MLGCCIIEQWDVNRVNWWSLFTFRCRIPVLALTIPSYTFTTFKIVNISLTWPSSSTPSVYPGEWKIHAYVHKNLYMNVLSCMIQNSQKNGKNLNILSTDRFINKHGSSIQWNIIWPRKGGKHWYMLHDEWTLKILH